MDGDGPDWGVLAKAGEKQHSWESPEKINEAEYDSGLQGAQGGFGSISD